MEIMVVMAEMMEATQEITIAEIAIIRVMTMVALGMITPIIIMTAAIQRPTKNLI